MERMEPMLRPPASMDLRRHPRALLSLPVRIRWYGPLGMRFDTTDTIDASREGLLVRRAEPCEVHTRVWVAFPYDAQNGVQPERSATVVRSDREAGDGFRVALQLEPQDRCAPKDPILERRRDERVSLALPIFVRLASTPFPEESMTRDISRSGLRFETSHVYDSGEDLLARLPWSKTPEGEIHGRVVRVEWIGDGRVRGPVPSADAPLDAILTSVAVQWLLPRQF